jgi:hypothetical protein
LVLLLMHRKKARASRRATGHPMRNNTRKVRIHPFINFPVNCPLRPTGRKSSNDWFMAYIQEKVI